MPGPPPLAAALPVPALLLWAGRWAGVAELAELVLLPLLVQVAGQGVLLACC